MAEEKKKKKEKSFMDIIADKYNSAAASGYLGTKAKVAATEESSYDKKKKKNPNGY